MSYLTVKQVCEMTGLKYGTIIGWSKLGLLPARRIKNGRKSKYFFVEAEVIDAIASKPIAVLSTAAEVNVPLPRTS